MIMVTAQMPVLGLENHHSFRQASLHVLPVWCGTGSMLSFSHIWSLQGKLQKVPRYLQRRGRAHCVFPNYQGPGGIADDQAWNPLQVRSSLSFLFQFSPTCDTSEQLWPLWAHMSYPGLRCGFSLLPRWILNWNCNECETDEKTFISSTRNG